MLTYVLAGRKSLSVQINFKQFTRQPTIFAQYCTNIFKFLFLTLFADFAQTSHLPQSVSFAFAERGKPVSLQCTFEDKDKNLFVWYKQRPGRMPQQIGIYGLSMGSIVSEPFNNFKLEKTENTVSLTIPHVSGDDEGMYFCGTSQLNVITFTNGTFLTVTGKTHLVNSVWLGKNSLQKEKKEY